VSTENAKAVSQDSLLHVFAQVLLPSQGHWILPPPFPTLHFTGVYKASELQGKQDLIVHNDLVPLMIYYPPQLSLLDPNARRKGRLLLPE